MKISERTGKTKRLTYATVKKLAKEHIITIQKKANLKLCRVNFDNPQVIAYIESLRWRDFTKRHPDIGLFVRDIVSKSDLPYFTLSVFGSYARRTATKESDLDMLVVTPDGKSGDTIEAAVKSAKALSNVPVHDVLVTYSEFANMLSQRTITVAKEVLEARYLAYGAEAFYTLVGRLL